MKCLARHHGLRARGDRTHMEQERLQPRVRRKNVYSFFPLFLSSFFWIDLVLVKLKPGLLQSGSLH